MIDQHPVTILADTITEWRTFYRKTYKGNLSEIDYIAANSAQWGADQELEACCEWMRDAPFGLSLNTSAYQLRAARRPKPPSLKEQALAVLDDCSVRLPGAHENILRRALEQLND